MKNTYNVKKIFGENTFYLNDRVEVKNLSEGAKLYGGATEINNKTSETTNVNIIDKVKSPKLNLNKFLKEKGVKLEKKPLLFVGHNYYPAFAGKGNPILLTEPTIIGTNNKKIYHNKNVNSIAATLNLPKL